MASSEHLKALLRSHIKGDDAHFLSVAMQLAAHEHAGQNKSWMINPRPAVELTREGNSTIIISINPRSRSGMTSLKRCAPSKRGASYMVKVHM